MRCLFAYISSISLWRSSWSTEGKEKLRRKKSFIAVR